MRGQRPAPPALALLSHLAHEISESTAALRRTDTSPDDHAVLDRLDDASRRLLVMTEGTERRFTGERSLVRPAELLCDLLTGAGVGRDRTTSLSVAPGADVVLELNAPLVERVVAALVDNAVRHAAPGPDLVEVDRRDDELVVRVLDRGPGYSWDQNGARPQGPSGLAQAARLTTALGGSLTVTPRPDGGTVAEARFAARSGAGHEPPVAGSRVLVVDDNGINRRLAAAMLAQGRLRGRRRRQRRGRDRHAVARRGTGSCSWTSRCRVSTAARPLVGGGVRTDAATPADVPIVALTAHVGQDERDACAESGMDDYLSKPFGIEALASMCRRWLQADQAGSGEAR